jgi:heme exporter protein C
MRRLEGWFGLAAAISLAVGMYIALVSSPPDYYQGEIVRIMYIHVPFAQTSLLAYLVLFIGSVWYLWKKDPVVDNLSHATAGIGAFFTAGELVTGAIWGKPAWNTWWTWDARLTSALVLLLILMAYLMLRMFMDDREKEARYAAILAIIGFVDLPIVYFSVEWWRTLHQPLSVSQRGLAISQEILIPLIIMTVGFYLLFTYMIMIRTRMLYLEHLLEAKKGRLLSQAHL